MQRCEDGRCELPKVQYPKCQHCGEQPARVLSATFPMGALVAMVLFCGNPACNAIHTVVPIGQAPRPEPLIVTPGQVN